MSRELVKVIKYDKVILKIFFTPKKHLKVIAQTIEKLI